MVRVIYTKKIFSNSFEKVEHLKKKKKKEECTENLLPYYTLKLLLKEVGNHNNYNTENTNQIHSIREHI